MKLFPKILTVATSVLLAAGSLAVAPIGANQSASAETIISQLGSDIDGATADDNSGRSVSLSSDGTRVAIGAPGSSPGKGQVRIYDWTDGAWVQTGSDIDGEAAGDRFGTSVSLSSDGTRVAIGATNNDGSFSNAGHVRVYDLKDGAWVQTGSDIDGEAAGDLFGASVSLSSDGTRVATGARMNDGSFSNAGHVRVYDLTDGAWVQTGSDIDGEAADDYSGSSVSLSSDGTRVAIGAERNDGDDETSSGRGHVRIYDLKDGAWVQTGSDIDGEAADDYSGSSVSLSSDGTRVAIGADGHDDDKGQVRVYDLTEGAWVQAGSNIDGAAADDTFGSSVSLSSDGTRVAIGAEGNDNFAGGVRVYDWTDGAWVQAGSDIDGKAEYDRSGSSVSLSSDGTRVAIGALYNDGSFSNAGHVRVHSMSTSSPGSAPAPAPAPYSGPLPTNYSDRTPAVGDEVVVSGLRLSSITSCTIDGVTAAMSNQSADRFTIVIPAGLEPGLKDLVITSSAGTLTVQDALTVSAAAEDSSEFASAVSAKGWTKKLTDSSAKIYAKDLVGVGKVQIFFNGKEIAWVRATSAGDTKLRTANGAHYLVRTVELIKGQKNILEVHLDGIRIKRAAYSY